MFKVTYDEILGGPLDPVDFRMQMADQSSQKPVGIAGDILVRIQDQYAPIDFIILDMGPNREVPLLLRRPFLFTTHAELHVGIRFARFYISSRTLTYPFTGYNMYKQTKSKQTRKHARNPIWQSQEEQCPMVRIKYGLNQQGITEVEINPNSGGPQKEEQEARVEEKE
jgi:hypothetical protein